MNDPQLLYAIRSESGKSFSYEGENYTGINFYEGDTITLLNCEDMDKSRTMPFTEFIAGVISGSILYPHTST